MVFVCWGAGVSLRERGPRNSEQNPRDGDAVSFLCGSFRSQPVFLPSVHGCWCDPEDQLNSVLVVSTSTCVWGCAANLNLLHHQKSPSCMVFWLRSFSLILLTHSLLLQLPVFPLKPKSGPVSFPLPHTPAPAHPRPSVALRDLTVRSGAFQWPGPR